MATLVAGLLTACAPSATVHQTTPVANLHSSGAVANLHSSGAVANLHSSGAVTNRQSSGAVANVQSSGEKAKILFDRLSPTQANLFISNADGSEEHSLTKGTSLDYRSLNYDPAWSLDGKWIAFTSERAGPANLYGVHPDGSGLERLTNDPAYDDQAAFSPDGKRIVFVSTRATGRANLWILDLATFVRRGRPMESGSRSPPTAAVAFRSPRADGSACNWRTST